MKTNDLLGHVAAEYLWMHLTEDDTGGTARYLLDCLTAEQMAAVARAVIADSRLASLVEIRLPRTFLEGTGLPSEILTSERTTYFRNASCPKTAWLLANVGDDEQQGLTELVPIGAPQLLDHPELWVQEATEGLHLTPESIKWWKQALKGLVEARQLSLERYSEYVAATRQAVCDQGHPIRAALGYALPALHLPRDTCYFNALNEKTSGQAGKWKNLYATAMKKRGCYLRKQTPTQALLGEEDLQTAFEKVRESVAPACHEIVQKFIQAPSGWCAAAADLALCDWENVKAIFDGLKREKFNLGKATLEFYDDRDPEELTDDDRDYLERLSARKTTDAEEEDEAFFRDHRLQMKEKPVLKARWDRFIFGAPIETDDFLAGFGLSLQSLFDQDQQSTKRKLRISCDRRTVGDLKALNRDAGLFFAFRYKGIKESLGKSVEWDVGKLFSFCELDEAWRNGRSPHRNRSQAKTALQTKFFLELEVTLSNGAIQTYSKQLVWKFSPNAIVAELYHDWGRLAEHPLVRCVANREAVNGKGSFQSIDLSDVSTLLPTYDKDRGSLVAVYRKTDDLVIHWRVNLQKAVSEGRVNVVIAQDLLRGFEAFVGSYSRAMAEFLIMGTASPTIMEQVKDYSDLLIGLCRDARGDRNREDLLRPILELGVVPVEGGHVASIVAPWHPLRMAAVASKTLQIAGLVKHLTTAESVYFGDTKLYFEELGAELKHAYYPEVVIGWSESKPELLALGDHYLDYSLHEPPIVNQEIHADTNENPDNSSWRIIEILRRYLALHPHEQSNLSVVLYNCDSARLPQRVVDRIQEIQDEEEEMRCQVILRHRDGGKLRDLYEKIIESSDADADSFVASEATRDFMARLRIGIMADEAAAPEACDGPPADVVFLQDVIARHAKLEWYSEDAKPVQWGDWVPPRWSRRRPAAADDMKSIVYLCCPVATVEGWNYLSAVTTFIKGDWDGNDARRLVPARQLDFNDSVTRRIFREVHNLGNWVVNYDELLDRRQLVNQHVKVIRYKQTDTQGRNMLISSNASTALLHRMVLQRVSGLGLGLPIDELTNLSRKLIDDANLVSGDLVLRAAKRGRNASELIGVVLSRYLIQRELGEDRLFGWYFLDDYADWLGQKEEQIADILALSPEKNDGGIKRLAVVISESKYVDYSSLGAKRKESQKQLRQTIDRIGKALFGAPGRLDRDIWLGRFSDMVLNGIQFAASDGINLSELRRSIRDGGCEIYLRGYSHVFVSGPSDCPECSDFARVADCEESYQEVFSRSRVRELLLHYWRNTDPCAVRKMSSDEDIWSKAVYRRPSMRRTQPEPCVVQLASNSTATKAGVETKNLDVRSVDGQNVIGLDPVSHKGQTTTTGISSKGMIGEFGGTGEIDTDADKTWLREVENRSKGALQQFQLQAKLVRSVLTPNAALLKFQGSANLTVEQVLKRRSEFLTTHGLNVISVRAESGVVAIAVARERRRTLGMEECWARWKPVSIDGNTELLAGIREENGDLLLVSPIRNAPHTLIAGTTGSGKSVLMQNLILSMVATNTPEQLQLTLIDPKMGVDYFAFEPLPHLSEPIITDSGHSMEVLNGLVKEMNRRYELLRANRVPSIMELRKKAGATERPPILWVVHDEFAEWMMTEEYRDGVSNIVSRLGVKARAAGIFLIFAAQRPDANVMPMQLRSNLGNRLVLRVDGEGTSEIALGEKGAERLLGKGHLAAKLEGEDGIITGQVPFVPPERIEAMVAGIAKEWESRTT